MTPRRVHGDDDWEEPDEDSSVPINVPPEFRTLSTEQQELTVRDLWSRFLSGELILEPDFQRGYVWDRQRASRFIESMILGLPVPPIYLAENSDDSVDVIDGHQRLETLFRFMSPLLPQTAGPDAPAVRTRFPGALRLADLEVFTELDGRDVTALEMHDRVGLWDRTLNVIRVKKQSDPRMKFVLFARLNLGSMALCPQELRNCIYRGPYNRLIARLAEGAQTLTMFGRRQPDKRMRDRQKVLRFFAISHGRQAYVRGPFRELLNDEMAQYQHATPREIDSFEEEFSRSLTWTRRVFSGVEFRLFRIGSDRDANGFWDRRMDLIYEAEMVGFHQFGAKLEEIWRDLAQEQQERLIFGLKHKLIDVMTKDVFLTTLRERTLQPNVLRNRLELWFEGLQAAIDNPNGTLEQERAIISARRRSTACLLCLQNIDLPEDSVLMNDGGAGLAHRYCVRYRSSAHARRDVA